MRNFYFNVFLIAFTISIWIGGLPNGKTEEIFKNSFKEEFLKVILQNTDRPTLKYCRRVINHLKQYNKHFNVKPLNSNQWIDIIRGVNIFQKEVFQHQSLKPVFFLFLLEFILPNTIIDDGKKERLLLNTSLSRKEKEKLENLIQMIEDQLNSKPTNPKKPENSKEVFENSLTKELLAVILENTDHSILEYSLGPLTQLYLLSERPYLNEEITLNKNLITHYLNEWSTVINESEIFQIQQQGTEAEEGKQLIFFTFLLEFTTDLLIVQKTRRQTIFETKTLIVQSKRQQILFTIKPLFFPSSRKKRLEDLSNMIETRLEEIGKTEEDSLINIKFKKNMPHEKKTLIFQNLVRISKEIENLLEIISETKDTIKLSNTDANRIQQILSSRPCKNGFLKPHFCLAIGFPKVFEINNAE